MVRCGGLVLLGAVLTVIAAWAPAVWFGLLNGYGVEESSPTHEQIRWWDATVSPGIDDRPTVVQRPDFFAIGFDSEDMNTAEDAVGTPAYRWRSGLPLRSLGYHSWSVNPRSFDASEWHTSWSWAFDVRHDGGVTTVVLPLTPIWPGFMVDTCFFAALSALILFGWRWMVRQWRLARGRCPACAYPIGSSAVCTECGHALPVRDEAAVIPTMPSS